MSNRNVLYVCDFDDTFSDTQASHADLMRKVAQCDPDIILDIDKNIADLRSSLGTSAAYNFIGDIKSRLGDENLQRLVTPEERESFFFTDAKALLGAIAINDLVILTYGVDENQQFKVTGTELEDRLWIIDSRKTSSSNKIEPVRGLIGKNGKYHYDGRVYDHVVIFDDSPKNLIGADTLLNSTAILVNRSNEHRDPPPGATESNRLGIVEYGGEDYVFRPFDDDRAFNA